MRKYVIALTGILLLSGCAVTPSPSDTTGPTVTLTEVSRGRVKVFESSDPSAGPYESPSPCGNRVQLVGTFWEISSFPVRIIISGADSSGIAWLRLSAAHGVLSAPDPATTSLSSITVGGTEYSVAQTYYPADDPRTPRVISVNVTPNPGSAVVDLEGGARDYSGNTQYTFVMHVGTNQGLCERFALAPDSDPAPEALLSDSGHREPSVDPDTR